jgi:hypothetical protein
MSLKYFPIRYGRGANDWRLGWPPQPIRTRDSRSSTTRTRDGWFWMALQAALAGLGVKTSDARQVEKELRGVAAVRTDDEMLSPMGSGRTIERGTYWDGTGVNAKLDEKVAPVRDFVRGFIPDNIVGAEDPGTVIALGRVYLPQVEDEDERESLARAHDEAETEWKRDKRSGGELVAGDAARGVEGTDPSDLISTTFRPGTQAAELARFRKPGDPAPMSGVNPPATDQSRTACDVPPEPGSGIARRVGDGRAMRVTRNFLPGSNRGISTADYAAGLKQKRAAMATRDRTAPVAKARVTGAEFAALRANKRA